MTPLDTMAFNRPFDLGIKLDGDASEILPRTPLTAAAYAKALPGLYTFFRDDGTGRKSYNVVGGAANNVVGSGVVGATVGGGGGFIDGSPLPNSILEDFGTVGGGRTNMASGINSTVGGGQENMASGQNSTVGGGQENMASETRATVGGGQLNTASGNFATVPGGEGNSARRGWSFAAGRGAKANNPGAFVWQDDTGTIDDTLTSTATNQFP